MAKPFGKSLLGLVAFLMASGLAFAQDAHEDFVAAVHQLRMGNKEQALSQLRAIVRENPTNEQALDLLAKVDEDNWIRLKMEGGEYSQVADLLIGRARSARVDRSRDMAAIDDLVETLSTSEDFGERRNASTELISKHGEFAVPALVKRLASDDEDQVVRALMCLRSMNRMATPPLIAALQSSDSQVRANAAAAIGNGSDSRGAAAIAALLSDEQESVRAVARAILDKWDITEDAVDLHLKNARDYLRGVGIRPGEVSDVVWHWDDEQGLVHTDVPPQLYATELAKRSALGALRADTANDTARMVLAQAYLAQVAVIDSASESGDLGDAAAKRDSLRMVALATGPRVLGAALDDARANNLVPVAVAAIGALRDAAGADTLGPLVAALDDSDSRVSYAAALALTDASAGSELPSPGSVVDKLAAAVQERALRVIHVIDGRPNTQRAVQATTSNNRGFVLASSESAVSGINSLLGSHAVDVIVINEVLPDRLPEDVISIVRDDSRLESAKILIMTKDEAAAAERFGDEVGFVPSDVTGESLTAAINSALEGADIGPQQRRAEKVAVDAAAALSQIAANGINLGVSAREALRKQLDRGPDVAVGTANALGLSGDASDLDSLIAAVHNGADDSVKAASARAAGAILGRMPGEISADAMSSLVSVLSSDASPEVKAAVATALGRAKKSPGDLLKLVDVIGTSKSVDS